MAKRTIEQLKHQTWKSRDALVKALKASGFPERGEDYEPGETSAGSGVWMLMDRSESVDEVFGAHIVGGNANPAPKKRGKTKVEPVEGSTRVTGGEGVVDPAEPPKVEDPAAEPPKAAPVHDFRQPFPHNGKPYRIVLEEGTGYPAHATHSWAKEIANAVKRAGGGATVTVYVYDKDFQLVGSIANTASNGGGAKKATAPRKRAAKEGDETPSELLEKLIALATRPQGVTRKDIREEVDARPLAWTTMIKSCERFGYVYSTSEAPEGSGARTVYHLRKKEGGDVE